jgi:hypothetical protein
MRAKIIGVSFLALSFLSACGTDKGEDAPAAAAASPTAAVTASASPSPAPTAKAKETEEEKMIIEYIHTYINGTDAEAKKKFVKEHIHPDIQAIFELGASMTSDGKDYRDSPKVIQTIDYKNDKTGKDGKMILVQSKGDIEDIFYVYENKLGFVYTNSDKEIFPEIRKLFK